MLTKMRNEGKLAVSEKKLVAIDLFAGIGGLSLGLRSAGIEVAASVELDDSCYEIYNRNFPTTRFIHEDIRRIDPMALRAEIGTDIDVVVGGPPCQGFSLIGLRDPNDDRSKLIFEFRRFVQKLKPKYFVMENVPGMLSAAGGQWVKELIRQLESDGYNVADPKILCASQFGAPQERNRVFLIGTRKDLTFRAEAPAPTHISARDVLTGRIGSQLLPVSATVWDAISDLPEIDDYKHLVDQHEVEYDRDPVSAYAKMMRGVGPDANFFGPVPNTWNRSICSNCKRIEHGPVLTKRFIEAPQGTTVPVSRLYKLQWENTANTLRAGTPSSRGSYSSPRPVHPETPRCISVREGARIQGFPDWFEFHPTKWHGFRQVGNSVCPMVAKAVGEELRAAEEKNQRSSSLAGSSMWSPLEKRSAT
jgi:DNA (cytosine-5)-methyltransferase 1